MAAQLDAQQRGAASTAVPHVEETVETVAEADSEKEKEKEKEKTL